MRTLTRVRTPEVATPARLLAAVLTLGLALATAGTALASDFGALQRGVSLGGDWAGAYISAGGGDRNTFELKLQQEGERLVGTMIEENAFGDRARCSAPRGTLDATGRRVRGSFTA